MHTMHWQAVSQTQMYVHMCMDRSMDKLRFIYMCICVCEYSLTHTHILIFIPKFKIKTALKIFKINIL